MDFSTYRQYMDKLRFEKKRLQKYIDNNKIIGRKYREYGEMYRESKRNIEMQREKIIGMIKDE